MVFLVSAIGIYFISTITNLTIDHHQGENFVETHQKNTDNIADSTEYDWDAGGWYDVPQ